MEDGEAVLHRNISPDTVLVQSDGVPILTGLHLAKTSSDVTVSSLDNASQAQDCVAPEIQAAGLSAATVQSDLYAMCSTLTVLFADSADERIVNAAALLEEGLRSDPADRVELATLREFFGELLIGASRPPLPSARYWSEGTLVPFQGKLFRVLGRLGSGSFGTTFKVIEEDQTTSQQFGSYVAKIIFDEEAGNLALHAYRQAKAVTTNPHLSTIHETPARWSENSFVALLKWVDGQPLDELRGLVDLYADDLNEDSAESLLLRWTHEACTALVPLHHSGLVHGDVSPQKPN